MNDTTWFWQIVDARGLADVSSDEFVALNELISKAERSETELDAVSAAIGSARFMDPPDGGDAPLSEQVRRMREALTTAEAERAELLREEERLGAGWQDISTAPKDQRILVRGCMYGPSIRIVHWGNGRYLGRKQGYAHGWQDFPGHTCEPTQWMPLPPEDSGQNLADAHSKSPDPSSQSERIAVLEAALRDEREACAQTVEKCPARVKDGGVFDLTAFIRRAAAAIRARSALAPLGEE